MNIDYIKKHMGAECQFMGSWKVNTKLSSIFGEPSPLNEALLINPA